MELFQGLSDPEGYLLLNTTNIHAPLPTLALPVPESQLPRGLVGVFSSLPPNLQPYELAPSSPTV